MKVALLVIATAKYKRFLQNLVNSADKFFLLNHDVKYYLFVDEYVDLKSIRNIEQILITHESWPKMTLFRYKIFTQHKQKFDNTDYLYYIDSDMIFENFVNEEIFDDIVSTIHPWFIGNRGTPENNNKSLAYIPNHINFQYMANAFFGGSKKCILNMFEFLSNQIDIDYDRGIIAKWHDESHANKFYILYSTKILNSEYCYAHDSKQCTNNKSLIPKISIVNKNNKEIRS